ncbi:MAG: bifunctional (p)ppGpp synthetase/guanosine-3',5'-bis(diphosphate) 3'-pyrophosphohydrolase [Gallionella sp.]|nr:bifunctional (p)ppGpp synthetase/guanosine-3',5'-bis(diphosphate) 3'-pyrophosphohydrolase [Gallionella sp.]
MVSRQHAIAVADNAVESSLQRLSAGLKPEEAAMLQRAVALAAPQYAGRTELTGAPLLRHALETATILAGMNMDAGTLAAAILHAVPDRLENWTETVAADCGPAVVQLVEGLSRMEHIRQFSELPEIKDKDKGRDHGQQIESLRKMLLAMVEDIRVVLIKLAERTQTMRTLANAAPEIQQQIARETQGIFAPLANRLGVWQVKWELEDLSLRFLEPEFYKKVAKLLDERRVDREQYIAEVLSLLTQELAQADIKADVAGRPKHIYSIINKMRRKGLDFEQLYDVRAVRILVGDIKDCYAALGLVHNLWQPIPGEFDDYIAHPKSNDYRSLHTAVVGPRGLAIEVQIRTHEMHQHSELGVAAHWRYKEGGKSNAQFDEKIAWLRQILEWKDELSEGSDLLEQFHNSLFHDQVYVLTPQGRVIDLPKDATPVDFAYHVHTDLGHRTRGAKVDGNIVPLNYKLQNGQRVEILTVKQGAPSRDWLMPTLGYLQSSRARAKVRHWFRQMELESDLAQGRVILDRELQRLGATALNQEKLAQKLHLDHLDDLLVALGRGEMTPRQVALVIQEEQAPKTPTAIAPVAPMARPSVTLGESVVVDIEGVGNLLVRAAKCCGPLPPADIVGYVTRERGVTLHRRDCPVMQRLPDQRRDRLLAASWPADTTSKRH